MPSWSNLRPGDPPNLNDKEAVAKLVQRIEAGVTNNDKVCTLRGKDLQRIIQEELGVKQSISSVYRTLHRLGYSCLAPRPRHEKQDLAAMKKFKEESAPFFVRTVMDLAKDHQKRVRVFFVDEARFGQKDTTTRVWAKKGTRPSATRQTRYEWLCFYAAVEPKKGANIALQAPDVNTEMMSVFLEMISKALMRKDHAVLIMDQAGWHRSKQLKVPANIAILFLPPYSPELNPIERLWGYMRSHYLSNRVYENYKHLLRASGEAWRELTPKVLKSVCACDYTTRLFMR